MSSILGLGAAVKSEVPDLSVFEVHFHDIHQLGHLTKDEHPVFGGYKFGQHPIQQLKFARRPPDLVVVGVYILVVHKQVWVVSHFP